MSDYVRPSGPCPARYAIVGEAPAIQEVREGQGFVGPSGKMLWPLLSRLAGLSRRECWVSNLSKTPLDNDESGEAKMSAEQFESCRAELLAELAVVQPERVLAVGALAAKALLGDRYTEMPTCNGSAFAANGYLVVPTWHPAAALRPGGEDRLAWTGDAIAKFRTAVEPITPPIPPPERWTGQVPHGLIGVDTEGTVADPQLFTWATATARYWLPPAEVPAFWRTLGPDVTIVYHFATHDWRVITAMGINTAMGTGEPWEVPYCDTMELAYLRHTEPQALKDLAYRHYRIRTPDWTEVVTPYYHELVVQAARELVEAGTVRETHSPKTGKMYKKAKEMVSAEVKPLKRVLHNPEELAKRMGWWDAKAETGCLPPSLRMVPWERVVDYGSLDPWMTVLVEKALRAR